MVRSAFRIGSLRDLRSTFPSHYGVVMREARTEQLGEAGAANCYRVVGRELVFGDEEREQFRLLLDRQLRLVVDGEMWGLLVGMGLPKIPGT